MGLIWYGALVIKWMHMNMQKYIPKIRAVYAYQLLCM